MKFMDNLNIRTRFLVLGVLAILLAALPTLMYVRKALEEAHVANLEASGTEPVKALLKVIQLTQQHRGLSALVLGGKAEMQDKRQAKPSKQRQTKPMRRCRPSCPFRSRILTSYNSGTVPVTRSR